jgi:hypothetical protein
MIGLLVCWHNGIHCPVLHALHVGRNQIHLNSSKVLGNKEIVQHSLSSASENDYQVGPAAQFIEQCHLPLRRLMVQRQLK